MNLTDIKTLVQADMTAVNDEIRRRLDSEVSLIGSLSNHIIEGGGKRLRPMIVLLVSRALGYPGKEPVTLAAIIELIHTATLLHDDVVDASEVRRGRSTANKIWGNSASVLVGDYLYSRAFEMIVELKQLRIMKILAEATNKIAEGEVRQLLNCRNPDTSEQDYLHVIRCKTAKLFQAAAQVGAVISGQKEAQETAMGHYGMHLGTAFQLIDDVLDFSADSHTLGKNIGDDLAEGKPTLPLIHSLREGTHEQRQLIKEAIEQGGIQHIEAIMGAIEVNGSIAYTAELARQEADLAAKEIAILQESPHKQALTSLVSFAVQRAF